MGLYTKRKIFPLTLSAHTAPGVQDYSGLAHALFGEMVEHEPLRQLFLEYGITGAYFCMANQFGTSLYEFQVGEAGHGTDVALDQQIAIHAAFRTADKCRFASREIRSETLQQFAGAIRGRQHVISCRMIAIRPHSSQQQVVLEDLSEIFSIILGLEIQKKVGISELNKEHALGFLSRYASSLLLLFYPIMYPII